MEDRDKQELISNVYRILECEEEQTRHIIEKFMDDIVLFDKKQHDYGPHNIDKFGVTGVLVSSSDKIERLINLFNRDDMPSIQESIEDSWQDLTVYGTIARVYKDGDWKK